jgi:hypothetical protein
MDKNTKKEKQQHTENIFDLTKLAPLELDHELKHASTVISSDDRVNMLIGFDELKSDDWDSLQIHDFIRYLRNDGLFRKGGFFKNAWISTYGKQKGKKCIQLSTSLNFKSATWVICLQEIDKIWKKKGSGESNVLTQRVDSELVTKVNNQQETIQYMTKALKQLRIDLLNSNNEQKRIINLIKKLHGIKSSSK